MYNSFSDSSLLHSLISIIFNFRSSTLNEKIVNLGGRFWVALFKQRLVRISYFISYFIRISYFFIIDYDLTTSTLRSIKFFKIFHCVKSARNCKFSGPYFPVFSPNAGKYGSEKLWIRALLQGRCIEVPIPFLIMGLFKNIAF